MKRQRIAVLILAAGCSSSPSSEVPHADITLSEPMAPSALAPLGVKESVSGMAGGERLIGSVTASVAACVKPALEREPDLRGEMRFDLEVGASVQTKRAEAGLGSLSAARCIESVLTKATPPAGAAGRLTYVLSFAGGYKPAPLREGVDVFARWIGRDWSAPTGKVPDAVAKTEESLRDRIRRCAFGAEPEMDERLWLVLRVGKGGSVMLGPSGSGDAADCIRRVVGATSFPDAGHDYAMSVILQPESAVLSPPEEATSDGQPFGMIGLLGSGAGDAAQAPWAADDTKGNMWGDEIGQAYGAGGLGLSGRAGTTGVGTIGKGSGSGSGFGRLGRDGTTAPPSIKMGATTASPGLPKEVVQRIVRQNFGRFRLCYENGLRKNPKLAGKVTVKFDIDLSGSVANVTSTTDMTDKSVSTCVAKAFYGLSFPEPDGGVVKVTYPISFKPSSDAPDTAPARPASAAPEPPPPSVGGKPIASLTLADIEKRLLDKQFAVAAVPGFEKGRSPLLFVRDESWPAPFVVTLGPSHAREGWTCTAGAADHMLRVHGEGCQRVLSPVMD